MKRSQPAKASIGYKRPPKAHQFKPGKSGNPSGRKRGSRNFKSDLAEELAEVIAVREGADAIRLTKQRALVKRLCAKALSGDARAMGQLVTLMLRLFPPEADDSDVEHLEESDEAIITRFLARSQPRR